MKVQKIEIQNYKGFTHQEIEFNDHLNLFIGANASGKTSLLEAVGKCLMTFIRNFDENSSSAIGTAARILSKHRNKKAKEDFDLEYDDINYEHEFCVLKIDFEELNVKLRIELNVPDKEKNKVDLEGFVLDLDNPPVLKFYQAKRGVLKNNNEENFNSIKGFWDNFYQDDLSFNSFLKWFYEYESKELRDKRDDHNYAFDERLEYVRTKVNTALKIIYNKNYVIKSDQIESKYSRNLIPTITLEEVGGNNKKEYLENKSAGEKAIITLVADIAYSGSRQAYTKNIDVRGIVLIDEIEAHLHPNWQRKIIGVLREVFPNIQFFITTHSPQVLSSVSSENVFVCENFQVSKAQIKTKGVDTNTLLQHLFDSTERPAEYIGLINEFDQLVEESKDIAALEAIITKIEKLEEEDEGTDISSLVSEMQLRLEAHKFDLEHEMD